MPPASPLDCFALLDDNSASSAAPLSRLYTGYRETLVCNDAQALPAFFAALEQALSQGRHAVALFSYEIGASMHAIAPHEQAIAEGAQLLLFDHCEKLSSDQVLAWLEAREQSVSGIADLRASVSADEFDAAIARIHRAIADGEVYQINYTLRLNFDAFGSPAALYSRLRARQAVPFGALIQWPDGRAVLSLSPELLVRHEQGRLSARPMKGTAPATGDDTQDAAAAAALAADPKNRAENVMITDLLRNDLGRIAAYGSVQVDRLFDVQRHGAVLQMTSQITARLDAGAGLADVFAAVFPCGSITGAPKRRAMQLIRELEPGGRGLYTGALGWFEASGRIPDFCLSVPIRTLVLQTPDASGLRRGELGVGAGIVHDSVAAREFEECSLKAGFLTGLGHGFELFETMRAGSGGCDHLELHLARLKKSAAYFGFVFDEAAIRRQLDATCGAFPAGAAFRLRLALNYNGKIVMQHAPLQALPALENGGEVRVLLSPTPTRAGDVFLRHKTTVRQTYDEAWREAEAQGAFDMLFFNSDGELTEGGRSNVFIKLEGRWFTPPLAAGLLPGVMREVLLADPAWDASERRLQRTDLQNAEAIVLCNSLRGAMPARLV